MAFCGRGAALTDKAKTKLEARSRLSNEHDGSQEAFANEIECLEPPKLAVIAAQQEEYALATNTTLAFVAKRC